MLCVHQDHQDKHTAARNSTLLINAISLQFLLDYVALLSLEKVPDALDSRKVVLLRDKIPVVILKPGETAFFPYAHLPIVIPTQPLAEFYMTPYWAEGLCKSTPTVTDLIFGSMTRFLRTMENTKGWADVNTNYIEFKAKCT